MNGNVPPSRGKSRGWRPSVVDSVSVASGAPFGSPDHIAVERGLAEFRSGRPVLIGGPAGLIAAMPVDGMTDERLQAFRHLCVPAPLRTLITASRAKALGINVGGPIGLVTSDRADAAAIF